MTAGKNKKAVDIVGITTASLGGIVSNHTAANQTADQMLKGVQPIASAKPKVAIVFAGAADEKAATSDDAVQYSIKALASSLQAAGARVYVEPSSPDLSTLMTANLRIGASSANATFIEPGSEIEGAPYRTALAEIVKLELNPAPAAAPTPAPTPSATPTPKVKVTKTPAAAPSPSPAETPRIQTELPSVDTGTSMTHTPEPKRGVFAAPTPAKAEDLITARETPKPKADEENTSGPRRVTKRGPEAEPATINMRPPPALKQFSPQKPVPRKNTDKKAPDLSR
jgi:hypothetical protein